jgi:hypothetical protein
VYARNEVAHLITAGSEFGGFALLVRVVPTFLTVLFCHSLTAGTLLVQEAVGATQADKIADALALRTAWINTYFPGHGISILEDFEGINVAGYGKYTSGGYVPGYSPSLATGVGTFGDISGPGNLGDAGTSKEELSVLNASTTPFQGRFNTTAGGSRWLDSNDVKNFTLTLARPLESLFFFTSDVDDVDGTLTVLTNDGSSQTFSVPHVKQSNGDLFFVAYRGPAITSVKWLNTSGGDGFMLDDFGTTVPEPSFFMATGAALLALFLSYRRKQAPTIP